MSISFRLLPFPRCTPPPTHTPRATIRTPHHKKRYAELPGKLGPKNDTLDRQCSDAIVLSKETMFRREEAIASKLW